MGQQKKLLVEDTLPAPHQLISHYLPPRHLDWHKGLSGHVLVIGGEVGFNGAPLLAAQAALRVGAGRVSIATRQVHANSLNLSCPEIMCHPVESADALHSLLAKATMVILGPGLGQLAWGEEMFACLQAIRCPLLIDADGLNLLAQQPQRREDWILTPHPGEAARLLTISTTAVQADRIQASQLLQQRYGGVCVLKGAGTLVLSNSHEQPLRCPYGNPGMATAGMGDLLSGVIAGLAAQSLPLTQAAQLGVQLHALAGDAVAAECGQRGMIASDLLPHLPRLLIQLQTDPSAIFLAEWVTARFLY